ncbi:MAG: extracellular solute-binding protein, partial [Burkholderiales bacterium]|nr:extracellular solute-binding protein [Anaerolineae bacterium]
MKKRISSSQISRRSFLKTSAVGLGAGMSLAGALPALAAPSKRLQDTSLALWWWADDIPTFTPWIDDTVARFEAENAGVSIDTLVQDVCCIISQFSTAAAAGEPPDIQFLFNGLYHMENVWQGYLDPVDNYIPLEVVEASNPTRMSYYDGHYYRVGWYPVPLIWEYNKDVFDQAGLDADNPPLTWDEWMGAADALKTAGFTPFGGGLSDGFWGEWYLGNSLVQSLNNGGEAIELFIGDRDFRDPQYYEFWSKLEEMVAAGFMNDDMLSIDLFTAIGKVVTGETAVTQTVGPVVPSHIAELGDRIGLMVMPVFGEGALAGQPVTDTQGWGIPSAIAPERKEMAANFLAYTQTPESLNALWELSSFFPANTTWDSSPVDDPVLREMYDKWVGGPTAVYIPDLMPTQFWTDAMFVAAQEIVGGNMTGEQAGEQNAGVVEQWRALNPDLLENYQL